MTSPGPGATSPAVTGSNDEPIQVSNADSRLLHSIFQNLTGKVEFDHDAVASQLGLSVKTVRNRWCEMRGRYKWNQTSGAAGTKPRGRAAKADTTSKVTKKRAPVTKKTIAKKNKAPTPIATDDEDEESGEEKLHVKAEVKDEDNDDASISEEDTKKEAKDEE